MALTATCLACTVSQESDVIPGAEVAVGTDVSDARSDTPDSRSSFDQAEMPADARSDPRTDSAIGLDADSAELLSDTHPVDIPIDVLPDGGNDIPAEVVPLPDPVPPKSVGRSQYGGYLDMPIGEATGRFTTAIANGRAWLVDPEGFAFFSTGVQAVGFGSLSSPALGYAPGTLAQYAAFAPDHPGLSGVPTAVEHEHLDTMLQAGFTTVGGWSGGSWSESVGKIPYTHSLAFASGVQGNVSIPIPAVSAGGIPDVFHPQFPAMCIEYASKSIPAAIVGEPWVIGHYTDNELRLWGKEYLVESKDYTLADDFIDESADSPAKQAFVAYLIDRYDGEIAAVNQEYGTEHATFDELAVATSMPFAPADPEHVADRMGFIELIGDAYFSAVDAALTAVDPTHLNLCMRFASVAPAPFMKKAGQYCDVVTINDYYIKDNPIANLALGGPPDQRWAEHMQLIFEGGGPKPIIVSEWGLRANDSGLPNTFGAGGVAATQQDRAEFYDWSMRWFLDRQHEGIAYVAGWHWFMYLDEPATGRFDGEDGNYGIVTIRDEKYVTLIEAMDAANQALDNFLVHQFWPSLLNPPQPEIAEGAEPGAVMLTWPAVPLAEGYRITMMAHPAAVQGRLWDSLEIGNTSVVIPLADYGNGQVWFSVEALADDLLHLGSRVVGPVLALPTGPAPTLEQALACESLAPVKYDNSLPLPNTKEGQSYARLVDSFVDGGGSALAMDFVPSSLAFVSMTPAAQPEITVSIQLPEILNLAQGQSLTFQLLARYAVKPGNQTVPASLFVKIRARDQAGNELADWSLADTDAQPEIPLAVTLPAATDLALDSLEFYVPLFEPDLPMEQAIRIVVDSLAVQ